MYCECGCGGIAPISKLTRRGFKKGEPQRFIRGHAVRGRFGEKSAHWKGGRVDEGHGYTYLYKPEHPRLSNGVYVLEHILVAEKVLGKPLPIGVEIHHVNEDRADNKPGNLVICQDKTYHKLLHRRLRAYKACGHAGWEKCWVCKKYDAPGNLKIHNRKIYHATCRNEYRRAKKKQEEAPSG